MSGKGKLVLLTGGNSGIGLEACKILCARGHTVVATVRSDEKGQDMVAEVKAGTPDADIHYLLCEMSDPKSIRALAKEFKMKWLSGERRLDILINNAGANFNYETRTMAEVNPEWDKAMVVNAMAPIMLTDLLTDNLKQTAAEKDESRVVMVNSSITTDAEWFNSDKVDMDDVMMAKPGAYTNSTKSYKTSKMAFMMATLAIVDELKNTNVKINSMCPGVIAGTNVAYANTTPSKIRKIKCMVCCLGCCVGKSNKAGGQYIVDVADGERGNNCGLFYVRENLRTPNPQVQVKENQQKMVQILREMAISNIDIPTN